ncbi:ABC transporter permease [Chitinasiproducens palmae]|uniref:Peptide/nickel transport system permease protein n=1 Tax=Chitinasiproducens palmae TaxID=1770053 RepID=A0A1H2PUE8_9BURK|nr:ABC transporter permease [Chitinasiproducens palmae]SDV50798.1 peptide/nickel transport system permease protein [Chitinasiproducens palmae]
MLRYLIRRLLYAVPIVVAVGFVCFMLVHIAPGDPINAIVSPDTPEAIIAQIRAQYGLDRPLAVQFGLWLVKVCHGDLGTSIATGRPVANELFAAMGATVRLSLIAALLGFVGGTILGLLAAWFRGSMLDKCLSTVAAAGVSIPHYWLGMLLVVVFSVKLQLLPAMGAGSSDSNVWQWDAAHMRFLVLPALTLSIIPMGIVMRTVHGAFIEVMNQEFVVTLHAKGLQGRRIAFHMLKNAAPSVLAVMGLQLGYLIGGSILVETVFAWPGTGYLLNQAIFQRDLPMLQGTILVLALVFVILNLLVDVCQTLLDPRIRRT